MKILRLDLRAIGPFTDKAVDLSGGTEGLHLVYGDNERGKTSALRALGDLFFGIPARSTDDFVHPKAKMRVGAVIERRDGARLEFYRRKGNNATLLTDDEKSTIDDGELRKFIAGCDRSQFEQMFGIDHDALVAGGREIVQGSGEVGRVLFAAGAGIADLRSIAQAIQSDADELFKPSGSKPQINNLLTEWKETTRRIRDFELPGSEWAEHKRALETAVEELNQVDSQLQQDTTRRNRLLRIQEALPAVARWKQLGEQLAVCADVPHLGSGFADSRRNAVASLVASRKTLAGIDEEIARIARDLAGHVVPEELLARAKLIEHLYESQGAYRKAQRDRLALSAQSVEKQELAEQMLSELRPDMDIADAASLRLSKQKKTDIEKLARRHEALQQKVASSVEEIALNEQRSSELSAAIQALPATPNPAALAETIAAARSEGPLEQQAGKRNAEITKVRLEIEVECSRLGLVTGDLDALERLPLPPGETIERFERTFDQHHEAISRAKAAVQSADAVRIAIDRELSQLRSGELPTEADLIEARASRERLWQLVYDYWQNPSGNAATGDRRGESAGPSGLEAEKLADSYRLSVVRADELVDLLRHESQRVAARDIKTSALAEAKNHCEVAAIQLKELQADHTITEAQWRKCWQAAGIDPLPPREMRAWTQRHLSCMKLGQSLRESLAALSECESRIAVQRDLLIRQLTLVDASQFSNATASSLLELLNVAEATLKRLQQQAKERREVVFERDQAERNLLASRKKSEQAVGELAQWRSQWAAAIAPLGLSDNTGSERVSEFVFQCDELINHLHDADALKDRVEKIQADGRLFRQEVEQLLLAVNPSRDIAGMQHEKAVDELFAQLQRAIADKRSIDGLQSDRLRQVKKREATVAEIDKLQALLDGYCREAGCNAPEELPAIEQRASEATKLRDQFALCEAELLRLGGGIPIAALVAEVDAAMADDIAPQLDRLKPEIEELESKRDNLHQRIGSEKNALASMDTSAAAALAAEDEQEILARLESHVARYLRLRLASAVLDEGIERYRKKNQGPVLERAGALFSRLTVGSFDGLAIDLDKTQIVGVRGNDRIGAEAMSDGSSDQLYLALRLASLETWIESHEPLPFIVDDILVSFDDRRSAAAFEVLAELSRKTQIIFFAHHRHLLEIAGKTVPKEALFVHEL